MSDPTAPCTATAHDPEALCDELHAARLDKANLVREVDHLQRESAHAHGRIAAALALKPDFLKVGKSAVYLDTVRRTLTEGTGQ